MSGSEALKIGRFGAGVAAFKLQGLLIALAFLSNSILGSLSSLVCKLADCTDPFSHELTFQCKLPPPGFGEGSDYNKDICHKILREKILHRRANVNKQDE